MTIQLLQSETTYILVTMAPPGNALAGGSASYRIITMRTHHGMHDDKNIAVCSLR